MVVDPLLVEFGRVDMKTAQGLAPLMDSSKSNGLMWMAVTEPRRKQPSEGDPGTPLSTLIGLTLQLYCPRKVAHDIGKYLRSKNIFLGDPVVELQRYDYFNPQTSNHFSTREAMQPNFAATQSVSNYASGTSYVLRSVEEIRSDVLNMFDNIVDLENIPRRKQSQLIATPLKPHQEQALHFMVDKEAEWTDGDETRKDSLYKASYRYDGRKTYLHVITGEESGRKPESPRGGILADEMGMGKTLSILSLVADNDSVAAARFFASKAPPISVNGREQIANSKATLIVCPLSTMVNWRNQLEEHFPRGQNLKWTYYHGSNRKDLKLADLANYDVVITTYHMLAADAKSSETRNQDSPLFRINWFRIVLDEAHQIRSGSSQQAKAAYRLACQRRWAVTGTPVQNRLEDLAALFKFLRVKPFHEAAGFNTHILAPFKNADPDVVPKLQLLVSSLTLRRMKDNLDIPKRHDHIVRLQFSDDERRLHDWFEQDSARQVNAATSGEKLGGKTYARILKAILYLRLICAHGRDLLGDEALKLTEGMTSENSIDLEGEIDETPSLSRKGAFEMVELLKTNNQAVCQYTSCGNEVLSDNVESDSEDEDSDGSETEGQPVSKKKDTYGFMTPCYHIICPKHVKKLKKSWSEEVTEDGYVQCEFCDTRIRPVLFELKHSDQRAFDDERERLKKDPKLAKKMGAYTGPHTKTRVLLEELEKNRQESLANPDEPPIKRCILSPLRF
jgi:SNF2 family DNA or RNA helicase